MNPLILSRLWLSAFALSIGWAALIILSSVKQWGEPLVWFFALGPSAILVGGRAWLRWLVLPCPTAINDEAKETKRIWKVTEYMIVAIATIILSVLYNGLTTKKKPFDPDQYLRETSDGPWRNYQNLKQQ